MLQLLSGSVSLLLPLPSHFHQKQSAKQTFSDFQTHQSIPVHIKTPKLDNKLKVKSSKPTNLRRELLPPLKTEIKNQIIQVSFKHTVLLFKLPSPRFLQLHESISSSAPASVCSLPSFELNKSQHCKIHMMSSGNVDMRSSGSSHFFILLFFLQKI